MIDKKILLNCIKRKIPPILIFVGGKFYFFVVDIKEELSKNRCFSAALGFLFVYKQSLADLIIFLSKIKKLREPFLPTLTEAETPQVTPSKLPYGTRNPPLSAATFLS